MSAPPFNRAAEDRRGERVVDDQRHAVGMRDARELFNVADRERGVGQRFGENGSRVGLEGFLQRLLVGVLVDEDALDAHALHRHREQVDRAAVDFGGGDEAVARRKDVEQGHKARRLSRGRQQTADAPLERGQLFFDIRAGGVGNA